MVVMMRVTTLKASADQVGDLLAYYAGLAEDRDREIGRGRGPVDYYLDPDEPSGRWLGRGRDSLGLSGEANGGELRALLEGHHPHTGATLGRRFGDSSVRGFDATFSAPKSVSVLWALTPDRWVQAEVLAAHDAAVSAALGWFETHGSVTRRGRDGVFQVDASGVAAAAFRQHTSRSIDPQLHTHAVISSKVQDETGGWLALDARFLKRQQRSIGWVYDAALRVELTARLGVGWIEHDDGVLDLACVPDRVREVFSRRSVQVDAKLANLIGRWIAEHDGADPAPRTIAQLERTAVRTSRPAKVHGLDPASLRDEWDRQARRIGFDPARLTPDRIAQRALPVPARSDAEIVGEALRRVSEESSSWLRADIARHLTTLLPATTAGTGEDLVIEIDRLAEMAEARCVALGPERTDTTRHRRDGRPPTEHVTDRCFTTGAVLEQERELQRWVEVSTVQPQSGRDSQEHASAAMAGYAPLVLVVGPAGTGKTRTTAHAVNTLRSQRRPVIGLAPSGKAADVLATEAGCRTDTLAGFLTRHQHDRRPVMPEGTTVILDEAGMAATADLAYLVDLVQQNRWRLVAVGDPAQLPSVARGGIFSHWCETLPHHTLDTPRRFTHAWEASASLALRAGDPHGVGAYAEHGRLHATHPALVASHATRAHQQHSAAGRSVAITTNTADTARAINREIQHLQHGRTQGGVELHDGTRVFVGDQIATRRNKANLRTDRGEQVRNRHTWTVTGIATDSTLTAAHPERGELRLPARYVARHVELGWAVTGYGNQGDTVDVGIAILEAGTNRNHAYVAMTRGREANHAIVADPTGTVDPAERLTEIIARPANRESALAVRQRLHQKAGIPQPPEPTRTPTRPTKPTPTIPSADPELDERVALMTARLDALQNRGHDKPFGRGLSR
ncbi:MAG: MobF family relaxase [Acidimicrobiales bacterium]